MEDFRLNLEYLPVESLNPYAKNTRKHEDFDVDQIAVSIKKYGFDDPIGIWGKDNLIVEGHGRLLAAKKLGMEEVPCIRLDHLTEKERRAYAIAHNKTAELSAWDDDMLQAELPDLDMSGFDFDFDFSNDSVLVDQDDFDESDLDEDVKKENVIVSINCKNFSDWESIKERIENCADEINATLAVKMA